MTDDIRPKGTVQVECTGCKAKGDPGWFLWVACDHPNLPDGPFLCVTCELGNGPLPKELIEKVLRKENGG
jgi:hypothetical protein